MTKKPKGGRPPALKMPDPIDATPEELAKAICRAPPKKDWRFLQPRGDATQPPNHRLHLAAENPRRPPESGAFSRF